MEDLMARTREEAIVELTEMTASEHPPHLTPAEIESYVAVAAVTLPGGAVDYPNLNAAAAKAWRRKAGLAASSHPIKSDDGAELRPEVRFQQYMKMHDLYAGLAAADAAAAAPVAAPDGPWMALTNAPQGPAWDIEDLVGNL